MNTPWGSSDSIEKIQFGVSWVGTPSHGGLAVSLGQAKKLLSQHAIDCAFPGQSHGYVFFEEDCNYAIAFYEHPEWKRHLDKKSLAEWTNSVLEPDSYLGKAKVQAVPRLQSCVAQSDDSIKADMEQIVRRWNPEYFGEEPKLASTNGQTYTEVK
ncbi:MAG: DUF7007 domain-containing protein [Candidatus Micrarchaeaceae archaeon]